MGSNRFYMPRIKIKVCGVRTLEDASAIIEGGADFLGFQFISFAKKPITLEKALEIIKELPEEARLVGVFVDENPEKINSIAFQCNLSYIQLHGRESPEYCRLIKTPLIKAFEVMDGLDLKIFEPYEGIVDKFLLDTPHDKARQPGQTFDWNMAKEACQNYDIMIAGGLSTENVGEVIKLLHPWGIDVSGGVMEDDKISEEKVKEFVQVVREAEK